MAGRYSAPKAPTDLTGRRGIELQKEQQEKRDREAAELAAREPGRKETSLDDKGINPETGRHGGGDDPDATEKVRISFPIEEMTFGREVVDPGEFDESGLCTRPPVLGTLNTYSFREGKEYRLTPDHAEHLRGLGYLFDFA